jgi:hypothetical protein
MKPFILVSYFYLQRENAFYRKVFDAADKIKLIIDCGGYSFINSGANLNIDEYCAFCKRIPPGKGIEYFSYDVPYDPATTRRNFVYMVSKGLQPIPVYTAGDTFPNLQGYVNKYPRVAIGGGNMFIDRQNAVAYIKRILDHVGGSKLHIFGKFLPELFKTYKVKSCDISSANGRAQKLGTVWLDGRYIGIKELTKTLLIGLCDKYKIDLDTVTYPKTGAWTIAISAASFLDYAFNLYKRYGTELYLATSREDVVERAATWED